MSRPRPALAVARFAPALLALGGCIVHAPAPARAPADAAGGHAPPGFDTAVACADWTSAVGPGDAAQKHDSFPELDPRRSCFVPVRYDAAGPKPDAVPAGCGYPDPASVSAERASPAAAVPSGVYATLAARAARYEAIAAGEAPGSPPLELACSLPADVRRAAANNNARTLRALAIRLPARAPYPYAAVSTFGYGHSEQGGSALVSWRPGDACPQLAERDPALLDVNAARAGRAAAAYLAGVAPVVTASGGAVHAPLVEAFLLDYLLACRLGVPRDAVLVDPCADHTHTNVRNTGALVRALGGRTAYLVTDDGLQAGYLEEWTLFDLVGGSIDQRALRDFGHLLGSHRRASVGIAAGFWYTPYRFWAEPAEALGSFTCIP